jgi:hypothetical protein
MPLPPRIEPSPPLSTSCPDGSAPDASGNCPPITQGPKESPSTDQGTIAQPRDKKPSKPKLPKCEILSPPTDRKGGRSPS